MGQESHTHNLEKGRVGVQVKNHSVPVFTMQKYKLEN